MIRRVLAPSPAGPLASLWLPAQQLWFCLTLTYIHGWEAKELAGRLVVDLVEYERPLYPEYQVVPDLFTDTFRGHPVRLVVDPAAGVIVDRRDLAYDCSPDFPAHALEVTGHPYRDFWMLGISAAGRPGRKFFDQLVRVDWDTECVDVYQAPPRHYLGGEPPVMLEPGRLRNDCLPVVRRRADLRIVCCLRRLRCGSRAGGSRAAAGAAAAPLPLDVSSALIRGPEYPSPRRRPDFASGASPTLTTLQGASPQSSTEPARTRSAMAKVYS
jgi:hypothetical protein